MTSLAIPQLNQAAASGRAVTARRRTGWIGIDVGTAALKFAQVEWHNGRWTLAGSLVVPVPSRGEPGLPPSVCSLLADSSAFKGCRAACALPLSAAELRQMELPEGTEAEVREMVSQELATSGRFTTAPCEFDFWQLGGPPPSEGTRAYCVLAVSQQMAQQMATNLLKSKLKCEALDGIPFALARAVELTLPAGSEGFVAAVDWGYTSVTLVILDKGHPVFIRPLRDCGLKLIIERLGEELGLTPAECRPLLTRYGLPAADRPASGLQQLVRSHATDVLNSLIDEITRTLSFSGRQLRRRPPDSVVLFGGGATIRNVAGQFSRGLSQTVTCWNLSTSRAAADENHTALLGAAAGLSLMGCGQ